MFFARFDVPSRLMQLIQPLLTNSHSVVSATAPTRRLAKRTTLSLLIHMTDGNLHDQITRLEADIEDLTELVERCRKIILISKISIAAGGIWLLAITLGAIRFDAMAMIASMALVIGGIVVFGSNTSTFKQTTVAIKAAEARRAELIDKINPRVVTEAEE